MEKKNLSHPFRQHELVPGIKKRLHVMGFILGEII